MTDNTIIVNCRNKNYQTVCKLGRAHGALLASILKTRETVLYFADRVNFNKVRKLI